jgi:hypothetical protein
MLASQNPRRPSAPLALRLRIDDLRAQVAPLDRYGPTGFGSAIANGIRALVSRWRHAPRGAFFCCE